jgi:hypothetical protein
MSFRFFATGEPSDSAYFVTLTDDDVLWWLAETADGTSVNVYRGRRIAGATPERWEGEYVSVPKGLQCGFGRLSWETRGGLRPRLHRIAREGARNAYPDEIIAAIAGPPARSVRPVDPGFVGDGLANLTGVWIGSDRGTYYIREVSETGQIAWVGENPEAEPDTPTTGNGWVNVFLGQRKDRFISGDWADVPKGEVDNSGRLRILVFNEDVLVILEKSGGFGGRSFRRRGNLEITLRWISLEVLDQQEWFFEADEPYFLALIALMDGRTVNLTNPVTSRANFSHSFFAPMLRANVGAGAVIDLSSLPTVNVGIRAVPGDRPKLEHPVLGIALRGAEVDESSDAWRRDRLQDWIDTGGGEVNRALQRTGDVDFASNVARWHEMFTWRNEDDTFGLDSIAFTHSQLLALAGSSTRLVFNLRGGDVAYRVTAELSVRGVRGLCPP